MVFLALPIDPPLVENSYKLRSGQSVHNARPVGVVPKLHHPVNALWNNCGRTLVDAIDEKVKFAVRAPHHSDPVVDLRNKTKGTPLNEKKKYGG